MYVNKTCICLIRSIMAFPTYISERDLDEDLLQLFQAGVDPLPSFSLNQWFSYLKE